MGNGFDPELAGTEAERRAQAAILSDGPPRAAAQGLVSRGNRVTLLDGSRCALHVLAELARRFGSAGFFLPCHRAANVRDGLEGAGLRTTSFLIYRSTEAAFRRSAEIAADGSIEGLGLRTVAIDETTPAARIVEAQRMLVTCGLPPLPGYFLRGRTQRNLTLVLVDPADRIIGTAVAMDESGGGPAYQGWYMVASVGVAPGWQGKGLGRWLNAAAIDLARRAGDARRVQEGVSAINTRSRRMIEACGLVEEPDLLIVLASAEVPPPAWRS